MTASTTPHARRAHVTRRISTSSGLPLAPPKAAPCVLDLLGHTRSQSHAVMKAVI
jgi:hypothetical protein